LHYVCERHDELPQYGRGHEPAEGNLFDRLRRWLRENW
jgi:hypothetical protein